MGAPSRRAADESGGRPGRGRCRPPDLRRDLRIVFIEVAAWSVMVGWGEHSITPFALAIGVPEALSGLVFTVPFLLGSLIQLAIPRLVLRLGSYRPAVVRTCALQALALVPLALAAAGGGISMPLLFLFLTLYWAGGLAAGPAWITWMDTLVPARIRARYFALRNRLSKFTLGVSLLLSGWVLQTFTDSGRRLEGFAVLFLVAALARLISSALISRQSDVPATPEENRTVSFRVLLGRHRERSDGRLLVYLLTWMGAASVSGSFLPALMLEQRGLDYLPWMGLLAAPFLTRILFLPWIGSAAARRGASWILRTGALCLAPIPLLWLAPGPYPYYLALAAFSGVVQGAHDLGGFLLFFEAIRKEERTSVLATFNAAIALALVVGSGLGAALLHLLGEDWTAYRVVFALSTLLHLAALGLLRRFLVSERSEE